MLKSWSLFKKLVLANVLYSFPVMALIYMMVAAQDVNIEFGVYEKKGNAVQRPLQEMLHVLLEMRSTDSKKWDAADVKKQLESTKAALEIYKDDLQFTEEGLKKRGRESVEISKFSSRLLSFIDKQKTLPDAERLKNINQLVADVRVMISHGGDTSNLILDPDLDSYYVMDMTLLALPQTQDRISEIREFLHGLEFPLNDTNRVQVAVYSALLKQSDVDRIVGDLQTSLNEDPGFYGESPSLKAKLGSAIATYQKHTEALISELNSLSQTGTVKDTAALYKLADLSFESSFSAWRTAVDELDKLLDTRIQTLQAQKIKSLALAIFALMAAVAVLLWISTSFNSNMKKVIVSLKKAVSETQTSGEELIQLSDKLSTLSNEQASVVQQTSTAMGEIKSMVETTMTNVGYAKDTAEKSMKSADETNRSVLNLGSAISEISRTNAEVLGQMEQSQREMGEITQIIEEIGGKTKVINDIVFQTKLLSFNASVEAARAGESGKGFAVVAQEVGNLAQMSGKASHEISGMLGSSITKVNAIASGTTEKVDRLMSASRERVETGTSMASECQSAIGEILGRIKDMMANAASIHEAAMAQSMRIGEVAEAIAKLDEVAHENMEMSRQTATQSRVVADQAQSLSEVSEVVQLTVMGRKSA